MIVIAYLIPVLVIAIVVWVGIDDKGEGGLLNPGEKEDITRADTLPVREHAREKAASTNGGSFSLSAVIRAVKERISRIAANTPAAKTKAFVAKQKELRKKYHAASYEEKVQIREDLIATNEAFQKDLGLDPDKVKALYEERVAKGIAPTFTADTTPYEAKSRPELAAIAKEMGVGVRGPDKELIQGIANQTELRRFQKNLVVEEHLEYEDGHPYENTPEEFSNKIESTKRSDPKTSQPLQKWRSAVNRIQELGSPARSYSTTLIVCTIIFSCALVWGLQHSFPRYVGMDTPGYILDTKSGIVWNIGKKEPAFMPGQVTRYD